MRFLERSRRRCGEVRSVTAEPMQVVLESCEQLQDSAGPINLQSYLHASCWVAGDCVEHAWMIGGWEVQVSTERKEATLSGVRKNWGGSTAKQKACHGRFCCPFWRLISQTRNLFESLMRLDAMQTPTWGSNLHNMRRQTALSAPLPAPCFKLLCDRSAWTGWIYSECILLLPNTWHNQFGFKFHFAAITVKQDTAWPRHQTNSETPGHCGLWLTFAKMWELAHTRACAHTHVRLTQQNSGGLGGKSTDFHKFTLLFFLPPSFYNLLRLPSHFHAGVALKSNPVFHTQWLSSR